MAKILVTGSSGFIGRHLVPLLQWRGHAVVEAGRSRRAGAASHVFIAGIGPKTDWTGKLNAVDAVIHLAGLAHRQHPDEAFHRVNDVGAKHLLEACAASGVSAFILLSSIAARLAENEPDKASAYGRSKLGAERHLTSASQRIKGIALRPPLVYGYDAPGNWRSLQKLAASGVPLPFKAVENRRSLCSIDNLCSAILIAVESSLKGRNGGIFEIADAEAVSLPEIIAGLREAMGMNPRLFPAPAGMLRTALSVLGQAKRIESLLDDLTLDPLPFTQAFGWSAPEEAKEAIRKSARLFVSNRG
jgi:UDP-glucose 4-epimerase